MSRWLSPVLSWTLAAPWAASLASPFSAELRWSTSYWDSFLQLFWKTKATNKHVREFDEFKRINEIQINRTVCLPWSKQYNQILGGGNKAFSILWATSSIQPNTCGLSHTHLAIDTSSWKFPSKLAANILHTHLTIHHTTTCLSVNSKHSLLNNTCLGY